MTIDLQRISTDFKGERCLVHARGAMSPSGIMRITMQPLRLTGMDVFYGMQMMESNDRAVSWGPIRQCENLKRINKGNGLEQAFADATPMYHKKTGKWLLIGIETYYSEDNLTASDVSRGTLYSIYDENQGEWLPFERLQLEGEAAQYKKMGCGCGQCFELENGDILIPVTKANRTVEQKYHDRVNMFASVLTLRCRFDGEKLQYIEMGNQLCVEVDRGLCEPSLMRYNGVYYMCIRNDVTGYISKSTDGLTYEEPVPLCFDDGSNAGNYNTQQHWIRGGGRLYLVYTRRGLNNDHVFRHRAPLVIAEFDTKKMCLIRETEQIVVPERGARLGNFGCTYVNESESYVVASEWMQPIGCEKYGSDNSIFIAKLKF